MDLKEIIKSKKFNIGSEITLKKLKNNELKTIFIAKNCKPATKEDIEKYAKSTKVEIVLLDMTKDDLGMACKKPYEVSVISV